MTLVYFFKKAVLSVLLVSMCIAKLSVPVAAKATSVQAMDIDVALQEDGSARITQHWTNACANKGTEYYLYLNYSHITHRYGTTIGQTVQTAISNGSGGSSSLGGGGGFSGGGGGGVR